ncbi:TAXI family TRAP transporter solute-binding subunit [Billgrantia ethanolica]|uniref:TAXI family TRAP transporter solute-binding subunit n=1 Tax=Billgrantia ethanolica TaxID=2733486 RepID=A0ABS9A620_9GAMM|nr:TAXI family TRAP transporter solute-binding subunit [Halomonas ethanolica]MCE8003264.1 TAXI family TRAP transporter solute-binding subunit [Halomonas ethanolica]
MTTPATHLSRKTPLAAGIGAALLLSLPLGAQAQTQLSVGTTSQASSLYAYFVAVSQLLNSELDDVNHSVLETGGGLDNSRRLRDGQVDWAMMAEPDLFEYYKGLGPFEGDPSPNFRTFWVTTPLAYLTVVDANSDVTSYSDLDGVAFNGGGRGSGTERATFEAMEAMGVEPNWFRTGMSDAITAFQDRRVVGFTKAGPPNAPDSAIMDAETTRDIRILGWSDEEIEQVQAEYPHFDFMHVDDTPYDTGPMNLRVVFITVGTTTDLPEDTAYDIFKTVVENVDTVAESYSAIQGLDIIEQTLERGQTPLHAGVARYILEQGYEIPEHLMPDELEEG